MLPSAAPLSHCVPGGPNCLAARLISAGGLAGGFVGSAISNARLVNVGMETMCGCVADAFPLARFEGSPSVVMIEDSGEPPTVVWLEE